MPKYDITIANGDVQEFAQAIGELYPGSDKVADYSRMLMFARTYYNMELTEDEYLFLSLKFKFVKSKLIILKARPTPDIYWIKHP